MFHDPMQLFLPPTVLQFCPCLVQVVSSMNGAWTGTFAQNAGHRKCDLVVKKTCPVLI